MVAASISIWVEDESESIVYERLEKLIDAINSTDVPCSVSEDVHDETA